MVHLLVDSSVSIPEARQYPRHPVSAALRTWDQDVSVLAGVEIHADGAVTLTNVRDWSYTVDSIVAFALPEDDAAPQSKSSADGWIELFDGSTLNGWAHMNGAHRFTVEDGGRPGLWLAGADEFGRRLLAQHVPDQL